jgi:ABC-type lipoprotein release transport system permease subunit
MPWPFLAQASLLTFAATVAAGLLPARRAARLEWAEQLSES